MKTAILDTWTETERGWGQRSDGCSVHLTKDDYNVYVKKYWDALPDKTPDEYDRPDNSIRNIVIFDDLFVKLQESEFGIRIWQPEFRELKEKNEILFKD